MTGDSPAQNPATDKIALSLPFEGRWLVRNSPARRIPSHGTDLFGERYAIDFVGVDDRHRTAGVRDWRTFLATEPPERYFSFGRPVLAPGRGTVVEVHDGELDHDGRRSQLALVPYVLGQAARVRQGIPAIAGNYVTISLSGRDAFVVLVHLKAGSVSVSVGQSVVVGQQIATCGNSGNSTQPHVHMQVVDSAHLSTARGLPMTFHSFREWPRGPKRFEIKDRGIPREGAVVEPLTLSP